MSSHTVYEEVFGQIRTSRHTLCGRQRALSLAGVDPTLGDLDKQSLGPMECGVFGRLIPLSAVFFLLFWLVWSVSVLFASTKFPFTHGMCVGCLCTPVHSTSHFPLRTREGIERSRVSLKTFLGSPKNDKVFLEMGMTTKKVR